VTSATVILRPQPDHVPADLTPGQAAAWPGALFGYVLGQLQYPGELKFLVREAGPGLPDIEIRDARDLAEASRLTVIFAEWLEEAAEFFAIAAGQGLDRRAA
jgi:hypothetical protein